LTSYWSPEDSGFSYFAGMGLPIAHLILAGLLEGTAWVR
jgi:hypothetical protein